MGRPGTPVNRRALVIGVSLLVAALLVVALALGLTLLYVVACYDNECSETTTVGIVGAGAALSGFLLWPAAIYLIRWRTGKASSPRWHGPGIAAILARYAFAGCVALGYLAGSLSDIFAGLAWLALAASWVGLAFALILRAAANQARTQRDPRD